MATDIYSLFLYHEVPNDWTIVNSKGSEERVLPPHLGYCASICLEVLRKIMKTLRVIGALV
jgi:hypothetical protein